MSDITTWDSGSIPAFDAVVGSSEPGFESRVCQLSFAVPFTQNLFFCTKSYLAFGPYLSLLRFSCLFVTCQPGPWRWKPYFGATHFPLPENEHILGSQRPFASISSSDIVTAGHLGRLRGHFRRSFNQYCHLRNCAGDG